MRRAKEVTSISTSASQVADVIATSGTFGDSGVCHLVRRAVRVIACDTTLLRANAASDGLAGTT